MHSPLNCVKYGNTRDDFYANVDNRYVGFIGLNENAKHILMTNTDPDTLVWLGQIAYHIFIKRIEILQNFIGYVKLSRTACHSVIFTKRYQFIYFTRGASIRYFNILCVNLTWCIETCIHIVSKCSRARMYGCHVHFILSWLFLSNCCCVL